MFLLSPDDLARAIAARVRLWPGGLRVQTATSNGALSWQHYPYRADVEGYVLLLTGPGRSAQMQILPWSAVAEADRPVLQALLAQHTQPVR
jgi:hypothetical protein